MVLICHDLIRPENLAIVLPIFRDTFVPPPPQSPIIGQVF